MNENTENNSQLTASTAADLIAFVPMAIGYQPRESFVILTMRGKKSAMTLRVDAPSEEDRPVDYARGVMEYLFNDPIADGAVLFVYTNETADAALAGENEHAKPYMDYARALETEMEQAGWALRNGWLVTDKGWTTYFCEDAGCCTLNPLDEVRDSMMSAEMVYRGHSARASVEAVAVDPAFIGSDEAHQVISMFVFWKNRQGAPESMEFDHQSMRDARALWNESLGEDVDEAKACELASCLHIESIRDRLMADAISAAEDEETFRQVLAGRYDQRPDWSRVDATEDLLIKLLAYTPVEDRAPLFCFLGWLRWYKGQSSVAMAYFTKAVTSGPLLLARLLSEFIAQGHIPMVARNEATAYQQRERH